MVLKPIRSYAIVFALLSGCAAGPDFHRPEAPAVSSYLPDQASPDAEKEPPMAQGNIQPWWQAFGSKKLDALVDKALSHSPTLEAEQAVLRQSEDSLRAGEGIFFPEIDASLALTRQRPSPYRVGPVGGISSVFNLYTLAATISYQLDVFGTQRRTVEGLRAQTDAQRYVAAATYLSLSTNVVNTAIAHAAYDREMLAARRLVALQQNQLALLETRWRHGLIDESSIQAQRLQLAQANALLAPIEQKRAQSLHLLSVLLGQPTADELPPLPALTELHLPAQLPLSLPSDLVRQRPDILQAEALLHVSSAALGVASAQLWPSISLSANGGFANPHFDRLGEAQSKFWSAGPTASLVLFHGGSPTYQQRAASEALNAAGANYRQVVLAAFAQVADTLTSITHDTQAFQAQTDAAQAAQRTWQLASIGVEAGLQNQQQLQSTEIAYQQAALSQWQAQAQRLQDGVALYAALGGSWWDSGPIWVRSDAAGLSPIPNPSTPSAP